MVSYDDISVNCFFFLHFTFNGLSLLQFEHFAIHCTYQIFKSVIPFLGMKAVNHIQRKTKIEMVCIIPTKVKFKP